MAIMTTMRTSLGTVLLLSALGQVSGLAPARAAAPSAVGLSPRPDALAGIECTRVALNYHPTWISSAVAVPSGVLAVEASRNRLLLILPENGTMKDVPLPAGSFPSLLVQAGDKVLVKQVLGDVLSLDSSLAPESSRAFLQRAAATGEVRAVYQWATTGSSMLAVGLVKPGNTPANVALVSVPMTENGGGSKLLMSLPSSDYYLTGYPFLASIGETGYFLRMEKGVGQEATIFAVSPSARRPIPLPGLVPAEFRPVPQLDATLHGPADAKQFFDHLAALKTATGLYAGPDGKLYLLAREPSVSPGQTDWWMFRVDPQHGEILGRAQLPTHAHQLTIAVSPQAFYLIERGEVDPSGLKQSIESMVTVPASLLEHAPPDGAAICSQLPD